MSDFRVASRYARSLFDLSLELKNSKKIFDDMLIVGKVCQDNRKLVILLKNPIVRYDYKLRILNKIFSGHLNDLTLKFFGLICRKNRASILPDCSKVFVKLYHEHNGIIEASVASATELPEALKKEFASLVEKSTGKTVELDSSVDRSLIGGYQLKVGDLLIDDSLKNKLNILKRGLKSRRVK